MKAVSIVFVVLLLCSCSRREKTAVASVQPTDISDQLCGDYQGRYYGGEEDFEIRKDHTFVQSFKSKGSTAYHAEGRWSITPAEEGVLVTFEPFMDLELAIEGKGEIRRLAARTAHFYLNERRIWFYREIDYFIERKPNSSNEPAPHKK